MAERVRRVPLLFPPVCAGEVLDFMRYFNRHVKLMDMWTVKPPRAKWMIRDEKKYMGEKLADLLRDVKVCI